ncbi:MAG: ATPase domain-containing protein [Candidatus Woesearchaeota archaeon]
MEKMGRVKTYITEIDKALSGGIPKGHITLVAGGAGTYKSSFCFNIAYNAALEGKKLIYITLEQQADSLLQQIRSMGYDLSKVKLRQVQDTTSMFAGIEKISKTNTDILLLDIANIRKTIIGMTKKATRHDWFRVIESMLLKLKNKGLTDIFVLDSLTALYALSDFKEPRKDIFNIFSAIKDFGCTTFLVSETTGDAHNEYGIENYLADGIINLATARKETRVVGELSITKMRATPVNRDVFVIEFKDNRFKVNPYWLRPSLP